MKKISEISRAYQVPIGVGIFVLLIAAGSVASGGDDTKTSARTLAWSERLGAGEVFPACGSSAALSCVSSANACGQTNAGVIQADGSCSATTPPDSSCPVPSLTMYVTRGDNTIDTGQSTTLSWESSDAVSCRWAGSSDSSVASSSGSISTGVLTDTTAYQICCAYASGVCGPVAQVIVTVLHPFAAISAE